MSVQTRSKRPVLIALEDPQENPPIQEDENNPETSQHSVSSSQRKRDHLARLLKEQDESNERIKRLEEMVAQLTKNQDPNGKRVSDEEYSGDHNPRESPAVPAPHPPRAPQNNLSKRTSEEQSNKPLSDEIKQIREQIEKLSKAKSHGNDSRVVNQHPFIDRIMEEDLPRGFHMPSIEPYTGLSDPMDHMQVFHISMTLHGFTDSIKCRAFPSTLKGLAQAWYASLPAKSISNFEEISNAFLAHFAGNRRQKRTCMSLMNVKQEKDESLRGYLKKFMAATMEVFNLDQGMAVTAGIEGLRTGRVTYSLWKKRPENLQQFVERVEKYAQADEANQVRKNYGAESSSQKKRSEPDSRRRGDFRGRRDVLETEKRPKREFTRRYTSYTLLNTPRTRILELEKDRGWIKWPSRMKKDPSKRGISFAAFTMTMATTRRSV